jgi:hypothetical protein
LIAGGFLVLDKGVAFGESTSGRYGIYDPFGESPQESSYFATFWKENVAILQRFLLI